jgi:hypothetical protein
MGRIIAIVAVIGIGIGASLSFGASVSPDPSIGMAQGSDINTGTRPFPGGGGLFCSPGWWKNHPEAWEDGICCIGLASDPSSQCGVLDEMLRARGPGSVDTRTDAQEILSACFPAPPCADD